MSLRFMLQMLPYANFMNQNFSHHLLVWMSFLINVFIMINNNINAQMYTNANNNTNGIYHHHNHKNNHHYTNDDANNSNSSFVNMYFIVFNFQEGFPQLGLLVRILHDTDDTLYVHVGNLYVGY